MALDDKMIFAGKRVLNWKSGDPLPDFANTIPRFSTATRRFSFTEGWQPEQQVSGYEDFQAFLADPASGATTGLVFGLIADTEDYSDDIVEMLVERREHFQRLTALFLGDITSEESEISWIELGDVSPIFTAYPRLEHIHICGNASSSFHFRPGILHNEYLKTLIVETGCLDRSVVHDILRSHLPALEHLELWTGDEGRGANCTVEDFAALFTTTLFPNLRSLGLRNSEFANDLAIALSQSPLLERLRVLDLSLGLLDDIGATALLSCPAFYNLEKLDIHYHYCSQEMVQRLQASGIEVDASDQQEPELSDDDAGGELRFVAVSE